MEKLSHPLARGVSYTLIYLTVLQPLHPAFAAGIHAATGNTQVQQGNVPVVNIATPNKAGISHNTYQDFNVAPPGAVLNNATSEGVSALAGQLHANGNLKGQAAELIINEVTGGSRTELQGKLEVFGHKAGVMIANPNGITCNGCGFINTPGVTLTTGQPQFDKQGALDALDIKKGSVVIGEKGLDGQTQEYVDILSRATELNGKIQAQSLSFTQGANRVSFKDGSVKPNVGEGAKPSLALDTKALGGMYANKIRLVATEDGVGVNLKNIHAQQNDITLSANGKIALGEISAKTNLNVQAKEISLTAGSQINSEQDITLAANTIENRASVTAKQDMRIFGDTIRNVSSSASIQSGKGLWIQKDAQGNKAKLLENRSARIATTQGDMVVRAEQVSNIRDTSPLIKTALSPTSTDKNLEVSNVMAETGDYRVIINANLTTPLPDKWFGRADFSDITQGGVVNDKQTQYRLATTSPASHITSGRNLYLNGDVLNNHDSVIHANNDLFLTGLSFNNTHTATGTLLNFIRYIPDEKANAAQGPTNFNPLTTKELRITTHYMPGETLQTWVDTPAVAPQAYLSAGGNLVADFRDNIRISTSLNDDTPALKEVSVASRTDSITANNIVLHAGTVLLADVVKARGDLSVITDDWLKTNHALLSAGKSITATAINNVTAVQSQLKGLDISLISKNGDVTATTSETPAYYQTDGSPLLTSLEASHDLTLTAGKSILLRNVQFAPQSARIQMNAGTGLSLEKTEALLHSLRLGTNRDSVREQALFNLMLGAGNLNTTGSVTLNSGGTLALNGTRLNAGQNISLSSGNNTDLNVRTLSDATRYLFSPNRTPELSSQIKAGGDLLIYSAQDLNMQGADIAAVGHATLFAGRDMTMKALPYTFQADGNENNRDNIHVVTRLQGGKGLSLAANRDILTQGAQLASNGNMTVTSGANMRFESVANKTHRVHSGGYQEQLIQKGSSLIAGELLTLISNGSILFQAAKLESKGQTGSVAPAANLSAVDAALSAAEQQAKLAVQRFNVAQQNQSQAASLLAQRKQELNAARQHPDSLSLSNVVAHPISSTTHVFIPVPGYSGGGANFDASATINNQAHLDQLLRAGGLAYVNKVLKWGEPWAPTADGLKVANGVKNATVAEYDKIRQRLLARQNAVNAAQNAVSVAQNTLTQRQQQLAAPLNEKNAAERQLNAARTEKQRQYDIENQRKAQETARNKALAVSTGTIDIAAKGGYLYAQAVEEVNHFEDKEKKCNKWTLCITKKEVKQTRHDVTNKVTEFTAGGNINLLSRDDSTYEASKIAAGNNAHLTSTQGAVNFRAVKDTTFEQTVSLSKGFYIKQSDKGYTEGKWVMPSIHAGGTLKVDAAQGISADIKTQNRQSLESAINAIGNTSGTEWVKGLNTRSDVQWNKVTDAYDSWDYKSQHLNPAVAAVIAITAAAVTAGSSLVATTAANTAASVGGGAITSGAMTAGMQALASQAAVKLVENQGDLSKTLKDLGNSDTVKATATAMVIGGALNGFDQAMGWNLDAEGNALNPQDVKLPQLSNGDWSKVAQRVAGQSVISSSLNTTINGGSFKDNLTNALLANIGNQVNAEGARLIGDNGEILGIPGKSVSHAVLAGISAEIGRGNAKGAAAGALAAEIAGAVMQSALFEPAYINEKDHQLYRLQEALNGNTTKEQTARVIGALTGALTTHTPEGAYSGADSAQNVYRYNMTEHMLQQYALENQRDILAADKGDTAAASRVSARREAAAAVAIVGGGGLALTAGGMTLLGATPELVLAARLAIASCKTNPALCLNQAGIYAADILAPDAVIGTGAITSGATLIVGKTQVTTTKLAQQLSKTADDLYVSKALNTRPVADFIKGETASGANLSTQTADYLRNIQKTNTAQLVRMFDPKQSENKLNVFGKEFTQVLGDGGSNKQGNTKVFATETLSTQDIFNYAQSLTGGKPLVEIPTAPGRYYAVLDSGATINLRNVSRSADETKARWTIEIKGNEQLEALQGKVKKRIEIKFR